MISGIPGSETHHFGVPYSLTEEFTAVYRMHPLMPDDYSLRSLCRPQRDPTATLREIAGPIATTTIQDIPMADLLFVRHDAPRARDLHNFPRFLQHPSARTDLDGPRATDILRIAGIGRAAVQPIPATPRACRPPADFASLTDNPRLGARDPGGLRQRIERVDLIVGMFAERRPAGLRLATPLPDLHPDGVSATEQRPVFHTGLPARGLHAGGNGVHLRQQHEHGAPPPLPGLRPAMRNAPNAFLPWAPAARTREKTTARATASPGQTRDDA